jgi:transcription elongation factor GreB
MTRYRKSEAPGSKFATAEGARRLREELENAEYIYGKKQLREIDRRVRFLRQRLEGLVVVTRPPDDTSRVFFGAWVRIEDEEGQETELRIVGPDEIDPARRYVSMDSPLARALMRRQSGDEFTVEVPGGTRSYVVTEVRYEPEP